mmetsp:Transcript_129426/g.258399  ORF Transcript_129426/g.258399 Transcript_129426/m.258399 type:complete len:209 (+) Transcript_129426:64-690(+)
MGHAFLSVWWKAAASGPFVAAVVCSAIRPRPSIVDTDVTSSFLQVSALHGQNQPLIHKENHDQPEEVIDPGNGLPKVTVLSATSPPELKLEPIIRKVDPQDHDIEPNTMGSEELPATPDVQQLCDAVKATALLSLQKSANSTAVEFKQFKALRYRSQVVFGVNYIVTVDIGEEHKFARLNIFEPLPSLKKGPELTDASFLYIYKSKLA